MESRSLADDIQRFYMKHLPGATVEGGVLKAPCPFCRRQGMEKPGLLVAYLNPRSFLCGYFRCSSRCVPAGFPAYFARLLGLPPDVVPGQDVDSEPFIATTVHPPKNLNEEIKKFIGLMGDEQYAYFARFGVGPATLAELQVGYNGRYWVYPYILEDGNCYAARCVLPGREDDVFWMGDEAYQKAEFRVFNLPDVDRCQGGALFITDGEENLAVLKELGYPGIAVPSVKDLEGVNPARLARIRHVFLVVHHSPEAQSAAEALAVQLGFGTRILHWPPAAERGYHLRRLAEEKGNGVGKAVSALIHAARPYSPFRPPDREHEQFTRELRHSLDETARVASGFSKLDRALGSIKGINILGGPPKAGKSAFLMQISTEMGLRQIPVIYYDFENGRQKIYQRTLCRLGRLSLDDIGSAQQNETALRRLKHADARLRELFSWFRVVTDRKLSPETMLRHIDFVQRETGRDHAVVVIDSLHKLPFKSLTERRSGIDEWLRHLESIRDERNVSFLVISELSRAEGGKYSRTPDLGAFKESGDIEYSADNALVLIPTWDPFDTASAEERVNALWLVASRERTPGLIAEYAIEFPYWGFREL